MAARINSPAGWDPVTWLMDWIRLMVAALRPRRKKAHQGAELLLKNEDALTVQAKVAKALGGIEHAFIVQKLHEWMEYNKGQDSKFHHRLSRWWTFNSYEEWRDNHFPWMSVSKISRTFRDLERMGIVVSAKHLQRKGDCRKWYTLDYGVLNKTISKRNQGQRNLTGGDSKTESGSGQNETIITTEESAKQKPAIRNFQTSSNNIPSWKPQPPAAAGAAGGRSYPPESDSDSHLPEETPPIRDVPASPPNAAPPPSPIASPLVDEIVAAWGGAMTAKTAGELIATYGENRVRGVFLYARNAKGLINPPGFTITELRENKYDIAPAEASTPPEEGDRDNDHSARTGNMVAATTDEPAESLIPSALGTPRDRWLSAYCQLELLFDRASFDTWLRPARFADYDAGVFTIRCHSSYARDMLQHRLYRNVRRVLSDCWGEPVEIRFILDGEGVQDAA